MRRLAGASYAAIVLSTACAHASPATSDAADNAAPLTKTGTIIDNDSPSPAGACAMVAGAKFAQWNQKKLMIRETQTYADGKKKVIDAIFTEDVAYARVDGGPWSSMNLVRKERTPASPDDLVKRMGLADCRRGGGDTNPDQPASVYSYGYQPDAYARQVTGKMWIADSSQLPVRQELTQDGESYGHVPVSIEARYAYGDAVTVPADAVRSDERRRWIEQQVFLKNSLLTAGSSGNPGPAAGMVRNRH